MSSAGEFDFEEEPVTAAPVDYALLCDRDLALALSESMVVPPGAQILAPAEAHRAYCARVLAYLGA